MAGTCFFLGKQRQWAVAVEVEGSEETTKAKKDGWFLFFSGFVYIKVVYLCYIIVWLS